MGDFCLAFKHCLNRLNSRLAEQCWGDGEPGLTSGAGGGMWRQDSARMTQIGDALADRLRVWRGLSAGGMT